MRATVLLAGVALLLSAAPGFAQGRYPLSIPTPKGSPEPVYRQLSTRGRDGVKLVVHEWAPVRVAAGRPVVLFLHGIAMHGEPYGAVAAGFTSQNVIFVVPDLRGHGRSGGERGQLAAPHVLRADVGAVIGLIHERYPGAPLVLAGDSMGGLLAADYAWRGERPLAGLALLVPAFGVHPSQVKLTDLGALFNPDGIAMANADRMKTSTREPGFIKARVEDKLGLAKVSPSYLAALATLQAEWAKAGDEIKVPLFVVVGGKDQVVDSTATRRFYDRVATPKDARPGGNGTKPITRSAGTR